MRRCFSISLRVMLGESSASPSATVRTAAYRVWRGASLSRKPLAPARRAARTYSSRSNVVSTSTRVAERGSPQISRVAAMPSTRGIRTSMSTTSGRCRRTSSTASRPSAASPTTSRSGWVREHRGEPGAHQLLVVGDHHPDRHRGTAATAGTGMRACTRKPSSVGPASTSPP